jgi:hypothetical protein
MPCVFCRSTEPLTKEHVFPDWLGPYLSDEDGPGTSTRTIMRASVAGSKFEPRIPEPFYSDFYAAKAPNQKTRVWIGATPYTGGYHATDIRPTKVRGRNAESPPTEKRLPSRSRGRRAGRVRDRLARCQTEPDKGFGSSPERTRLDMAQRQTDRLASHAAARSGRRGSIG